MEERFNFRALINGELIQFNLNDVISQKQPFSIREVLRKKKIDLIEQCTGQKEKNGKLLIFEGDIVTDGVSVFLVVWNDESSEFCLQEDNVLHEFDNNVFIIGNIHENKDLLI